MTNKSDAKSFMQKVNDLDVYCELRGGGPTIVLIPAGEGDCGLYQNVADALADEFTILMFDMRGCSRTSSPPEWKETPPKLLADDISGLVNILGLAPATFYGCSSGGQAVLSIGVHYPEIVRNLMIHEAAVNLHTALSGPDLPGYGFTHTFLKEWQKILLDMADGPKEELVSVYFEMEKKFNPAAWAAIPSEYFERVAANPPVWAEKYFGTVDARYYTDEELSALPPLVVSAGWFSAAGFIEGNRVVAEKAGAELVWLPCMHYPEVSTPDLLTDHIRKYAQKFL